MRNVSLGQLAVELRISVGQVARRLRQLYATPVDGVPTFTQLAVLLRLDREGPSRTTTLAAEEHITSQAVTIALRDLERLSLITRRPSGDDGRVTVVAITAAGTALLRDREAANVAAVAEALRTAFTAAERRQLVEASNLLARLAIALASTQEASR